MSGNTPPFLPNTRVICCNMCSKELNPVELATYPSTWQYSGDMYCGDHEERRQFIDIREKLWATWRETVQPEDRE